MKSFSWTLALRYLNPLRTFVSIITLISLLGVAFGVMVLIVVLSVHAGFERNLKEILLGYSPHVTVSSAMGGIENWQEMEEGLATETGVKSAYAVVEGYVLLDTPMWRRPVGFRAFNTENEGKVKEIDGLLDREGYPSSQADMGLDDRCVISRQLAEGLGLQVGDTVRVLAASNLDAVMKVYDVPKKKAWDLYPEIFTDFEGRVKALFETKDDREVAKSDAVTEAYRVLQVLYPIEEGGGQPMRQVETRMIGEILDVFDTATRRDDGTETYPVGTKDDLLARLAALRELDTEKADVEAFRSVEKFVLPKELTVYGVYGDTKRAVGPELFIPLVIGMELKGLEGVSESIGVLCDDPYTAGDVAADLKSKLGPEWIVRSWMETHAQQFQLVRTEKIMMSFALSFITVLSAFSIMAVMYTVTVQKRQEIGVMKALGASSSQIVRVFLYQGLIVGIGGALLGLGMGLTAIHYREYIVSFLRKFGVDPFPSGFHGMSELPAEIVPEQLVLICLVAVVLCLVAALIPALMAAFRDPAKSLRNL